MIAKSSRKFTKAYKEIIWWVGIIGIISLTIVPIEWFFYLFQNTFLSTFIDKSNLVNNGIALTTIITPVRGIIFLCSFSILAYPILLDIYKLNIAENSEITWTHALRAALAFFVLSFLVFPGQIYGLAQEYANSSLVFFTKTTTLNYHLRFLMPALANILFFRGDYFFLIFSYLCCILLLFVVRLWFQRNQIPISWWQFVSLGTVSFIYFQISAPGYPDVLINIFIVTAFTFSLNTKAKLSLFTLSLVTHEASLIIWSALAWLLFDNKKDFLRFMIISGIYLLIWTFVDHGLAGILGMRQSGGVSNLEWVWNSPVNELLGMIFSLKGLWGLVIGALWYLMSQRRYKESFQITLILAAGLLMTFLGVDTSRLFGWTFMAILISWKVLVKPVGNFWVRFINAVTFINLLIPPVYIQLNFASSIRPGLYKIIIDYISGLFIK